ncbi:uncharacterized protein N7525_003658 [Penicillium rubens]|uniref:uncharacterized protein n=1 Tax=Penicillium rubens TaxID=1108849 RepID=UPI002A5B0163|nr:uncharacterized protein N7525_003658 [Penicillium rubens]KAJ5838470.1 hypothetical protein N7525_003658 [Penicillium rubens]
MRFSIAALTLGAAGAMAGVVTETVTEYTTYCPEATSVVHGSKTYSISTPGYITMSHGPYTVTRPLVTSTVTECNSCVATSTPLVPSAGSTGVPSAPSSAATPSQPAFNAGAINAATGAGAGLAAVFGAVALLL